MPSTEVELFTLALDRLDDLKLDLEDGDESEASHLRKVGDEVELRRIFANRLKYAARGKYTTGSEEELADKSRTDIRLHNPKVEARISIELKIADKEKWTAAPGRQNVQQQTSRTRNPDGMHKCLLCLSKLEASVRLAGAEACILSAK